MSASPLYSSLVAPFSAAALSAADPAQAISFNPADRSATLLPLQSNGGANAASAPGHAPIAQPNVASVGSFVATDPAGDANPNQVFGSDDRVHLGPANMSNLPYSSIGRVSTLWPDGSKTSGSGAMLGPRTMLTAGDMIYDSTRGGFAQQIYFFPGQSGTALVDPNTNIRTSNYQLYGAAIGTSFTTYNGWKDNHDLNFDIGYVTLDRDIGNFTGWMGWGTNSDSFFSGKTLSTAGYPTGASTYDMYSSSGTIQTVNPNNFQSQIDTVAGQIGGPLWFLNSSNSTRTMYGVDALSSASFNQFTRITSSVFNDLQARVQTDATTTDLPNLIDFNSWFGTSFGSVIPGNVSAGQQFSALMGVFNEGTAAATNFSVSFYASTDTSISGADYLLGTVNIPSLAALTATGVTLQTALPSIPTGNYHLGWIISSGQTQFDPTLYKTGVVAGSTFTVGTTLAGGSITGVVFNDLNNNGSKDGSETGLPGWTVYLDGNNNGQLDSSETSLQSQGDGSYTFTNLSAGTYYVREVSQSNWVQTQPTAVGQVVVTDNVAAILQTGVNQIGNHQFKLKSNGDGTPAATSASGFNTDANPQSIRIRSDHLRRYSRRWPRPDHCHSRRVRCSHDCQRFD